MNNRTTTVQQQLTNTSILGSITIHSDEHGDCMMLVSDSTPVEKLPEQWLQPFNEASGEVWDAVLEKNDFIDFSKVANDDNNKVEITKRFLVECEKQDIDIVSVGMKTNLIIGTKTFPFGVSDSVFTREVKNNDSWPAIWRVTKQTKGLRNRGGNSMQAQVEKLSECLIQGVWVHKNGEWYRWDGIEDYAEVG